MQKKKKKEEKKNVCLMHILAFYFLDKPEKTKCQTNNDSSVFQRGKDNVTFYFSAESRPQECNVSLVEHKNSVHVIQTTSGTCDGSLTELFTLSTDNMKGGVHTYSCLPQNKIGPGEGAYANITIEGNGSLVNCHVICMKRIFIGMHSLCELSL